MTTIRTRGMKAIAALAIGFLLAGVSATAATADQPDFICPELSSGKINTTGDPATVPYTAPAGYVVDYYCVKAGTEGVTVPVTRPTQSVTIDHPNKDSVSHYSVHYIPAPPTAVTPVAPTVVPQCGPNNDTVTPATTQGVTYNVGTWSNNSLTVTATAKDGYTLTGTTQWTFTDNNVACEEEDVEVTPVAPTVVPQCGPKNDTVTIPTTEGVTYNDTGWVNNSRTITATAKEGYKLTGTTEWTFTDENIACEQEPVTVSLNLTYITACSPDPTNTWRIRNSSDMPVPYTLEYYGQGVVASGTAPVGDSFVNLSRETATAILKWGGGDSGIVAGSKTKASGVDQDCRVEVTPTAPTVTPICAANNDTVTIPTTEGVTYNDTGWVNNSRTITATAKEGYKLTGTTEWTFTDQATICPIEIVDVSVETAPSAAPICGPNNDNVTITPTEGVKFSDTGWVNNKRTITATAEENYSLEGTSEWTFTDVPVAGCPDEPPVFSFTPKGELAYTGTSSNTGGIAALALFLMSAGTVLVARRARS